MFVLFYFLSECLCTIIKKITLDNLVIEVLRSYCIISVVIQQVIEKLCNTEINESILILIISNHNISILLMFVLVPFYIYSFNMSVGYRI